MNGARLSLSLLPLLAACGGPEASGRLTAAFVPETVTTKAGEPLRVELRLQNVGPGECALPSASPIRQGIQVHAADGRSLPCADVPSVDTLPLRWPRGHRVTVAVDPARECPDLARPGLYRVTWSHPSFSPVAALEVHVMADAAAAPVPAAGKYATIRTNFGDIVIEFHPEDAPRTVRNFVTLARKGFYNGLTFHRIIPGFMLQGGCPKGNGSGGPGYTIPAEFNKWKHGAGTVSMARTSDPDSAGSQFFICFAPASHLDGQYTAFAQVVRGMDVVKKIEPVGSPSGASTRTVRMDTVTIHDALDGE